MAGDTRGTEHRRPARVDVDAGLASAGDAERDGVEDPALPPLTLREEDHTPLFRQIAYQLSYLITSGRLAPGSRLPPVRRAAADLGVRVGSVAEAYRMLQGLGLVEAGVGRGTFVTTPTAAEPDVTDRQALLSAEIERLLRRSRSMGFRPEEVRHHVEARLGGGGVPATLLVAAPSQAIGRKYATSIETRIGVPVEVVPVTIDAIERREALVEHLLRSAYFIATFARFVRQVEVACGALSSSHRVTGFGTVEQPATVAALRTLAPSERVCLVTREPTLDLALNLIAELTGRRRDDMEICDSEDERTLRAALERCDRVLYTFTAIPTIVRVGVPSALRLELEFDIMDDSLRGLRRLLGYDDAAQAEARS